MEFKVINSLEELLKIKEEWNELVEKMDNPQIFYKWEWVTTYLKYFDNKLNNNLRVLLTYEKKNLIAIFPMVNDGRVLRFITNKTVDYNNIYIDKSVNKYTVIEKSINYIVDNFKNESIIFNNITAGSELYIINDILFNKFDYNTVLEESVIVPILDNKSRDRESKLRKKQLKDIERRIRKVQKDKELTFSIGCELDNELWNFIQENHKKKWNRSVFKNEDYVLFYNEISSKINENMQISKVEIDGEIAAAHFGFKDKRKIYYYIPIYNEKYSKIGVGYMLLKEIIDKYAYKDEFDFLRGNEGYKFNWTDNIRLNYNLYAEKSNIKSFKNYLKVYFKKSKFLRQLLKK
ncbi:GNAT family N-acetyltransferase [Clostridium perfringens]|uniref:GNAT family N-acetyltransferase n=1 Tax=Clostridium perfringens TaxID=1502 RepID=UPI0039ED85E8